MSVMKNKWLRLPVVIAILALFGCATTRTEMEALQGELDDKNLEIEQLTMQNRQKDLEIVTYRDQLDEQMKSTKEAEMRAEELEMQMADAPFLPLDASPGECYARVFVAPEYATIKEQVLIQDASEKIEIIEAKYEMTEQKVLVKEASTRVETIPAKYEVAEEKVLVSEAHVAWQKGRGLVEKVDNATGEIMCLVAVPAQYKTVKKKVMVEPPSTRVVNVPASYETVKIGKLISPPKEELVQVPAKYETITRTEMISEGGIEWRKVLCETNMTADMIKKIQTSLKDQGHDPGPIDGIIGKLTNGAINSFQKEKGLATGALTYRTIESLGIEIDK